MKTAQWDTGFFDPPSEFITQDANDCDLVFRKNEQDYAPLFFCSRNLPKILSCIAREMRSLSRENSVIPWERKPACRESGVQLHHWYQSVLKDIYLDVSSKETLCPASGDDAIEFCIAAKIAYDIPSSEYEYISLTLPPLWQGRIQPTHAASCTASTAAPPAVSQTVSQTASPIRTDSYPSQVHIKSEHAFCEFRYVKSSGIWYSRLRPSGHKKRILRRSASPEDSYRILDGA